jgi:hypothetical protein
MKKSTLIFIIVIMMFLFISPAYSQDCGKCPLSSTCAPKIQPAADKDPVVYVKQDDKFYHLKECKIVAKAGQDVYKAAKLSETVKPELKPCTECKPPVIKIETTNKEPEKK